MAKTRTTKFFRPMLELARSGPAPLLDPLPGIADREHYHIAVVIPPFRRGSGGHNSIFQMLSRLERKGHAISIWVNDPDDLGSEWPAATQRHIREFFAPFDGPVFKGFDDWYGADIAIATGWDTVHAVMQLDHCLARAYLVHDHETQFHPTSAESYWAEQTYSLGLHSICSSPWLERIVSEQHGATTSAFDFGVDHDVYFDRGQQRDPNSVIFYSREITPRRAVPLGLLALEELKRRRPETRIITFGDKKPPKVDFEVEHLGVASPQQLAEAYATTNVGLVLSMTNYSLIPQEMLACGLPCVDLAGFCAESVFSVDGPVLLSPFEPVELCSAVERLLDEPALWTEKSEQGKRFVAGRTWDRAAQQLEAGIREAFRLRLGQHSHSAAHSGNGQGTRAAENSTIFGKDTFARSVPCDDEKDSPVSDRLSSKLTSKTVAAIEAALTPEELAHYQTLAPSTQRRLLLYYGIWYEVEGVQTATGLLRTEPPAEIHSMARGALAAGGDHYSANFIVEALNGSVEGVHAALDFGCSSGRVVRSLAAAYPAIEWHGVDPNPDAITWATDELPMVSFAVSQSEPPLEFGDESFDLVYAVSIWSHFSEDQAKKWLGEMHRILRPNGHLVLTLHGFHSLQFYAGAGSYPTRYLEGVRRALYRDGYWFKNEFGPNGDHGVIHPGWGTAFISPEWLLRNTTPKWSVERYLVGRNCMNQDVVTLRREAT